MLVRPAKTITHLCQSFLVILNALAKPLAGSDHHGNGDDSQAMPNIVSIVRRLWAHSVAKPCLGCSKSWNDMALRR